MSFRNRISAFTLANIKELISEMDHLRGKCAAIFSEAIIISTNLDIPTELKEE